MSFEIKCDEYFPAIINICATDNLAISAPVAQGIEHRPPEAGAQVRFLSGARTHLTIKRDIDHSEILNLSLYLLV